MNRTMLILRHEFLTTIKKKGFIILTLALPVLALLGIGIFQLASSMVAPAADVMRIGYVDHIGGFNPLYEQGTIQLIHLDSEDAATQALTQGDINEYFVIPADYVATGIVSRYTLEKELSPPPAVSGAIEGFLDSNLLASQVPPELIGRVLTPTAIVTTTLTTEGAVAVDQGGFGNFILPALFGALLAIALNVSANYVLQSLGEEKENRLMEILLSSVSPEQLLTGKLLGRGAAGLLQVLIWVISMPILLRLASSTIGGILSTIQLPPGLMLVGITYFILGYLLFAVVSLAIAAISSTVREAQGIAPLFTLAAVAPFWFVSLLMFFPNSPVWVVFSIVPFSAPVLMMLRLGLSGVPAWQLVVSMIVLVLSVAGGLWVAAKLLRIYLLMYGKRPRLRELVRALRAS
ncbi:MAG: ABC transporter permease [Candidatus Atribacteria bacterium]|nr:MAG: ABC transporter permease [Candidatus Atribacteria bacterium]